MNNDDDYVSCGPVSTMPGTVSHPREKMCDDHPDRTAVARIQGETDSFGCEYFFACEQCVDEFRAYRNSPEARTGVCDWCKSHATDLRQHRDFEEGFSGPLYSVCGGCRKKESDRANEEWEQNRQYDDYDE